MTAVVEVSADGEVWRAVSAPFTSTDYSLRAVPLTGRVTSARWRVRFEKPANTNVTLYEAEFGERRGGTGR